MNDIDLIIFDCDGVLIDSEPIACRTLAEAVTRGGVPISPEEVLVQFTGRSEVELKQMLTVRGLADAEGVFARWHGELYETFRRELAVMDGMLGLVRSFEVMRCVASNSTLARLESSLGLTPLWADFAPHVYSAEMVASPKPAPDLIEHCLGKTGIAARHALMIDDSPAGVRAALAAGVRAIGFVAANETRSGRREALMDAGALSVAVGADELADQLSRHVRMAVPQL